MDETTTQPKRRDSFVSQNSQTASNFIDEQLKLEADAREALPYSFDSCTKPLGALRQSLFSCLTCNPPPCNPDLPYAPAGVCYSCSISCHGEHDLVELFTKRNFVCDCGTTRFSPTSPCFLRTDPKTDTKGVHSENPAADNKYNHNFKNRFCGCSDTYDPHQEKGTMFQCLGLGATESGCCGEDWWHPECLLGLPRSRTDASKSLVSNNIKKDQDNHGAEPYSPPELQESSDEPLPQGFPDEDSFETFICYKCLDANSWLKRYAGTPGFLPPIPKQTPLQCLQGDEGSTDEATGEPYSDSSKKRKFENDSRSERGGKRVEENLANEEATIDTQLMASTTNIKKHDSLPVSVPKGTFSLFVKEDFRDHLCLCPACFPMLAPHPQLREEEDVYDPPISDVDDGINNDNNSGGSAHTGSLLNLGESALSNMDRVKAIEGVMVYNHLRDKVKEFLKPFADSGQAVGAEDIKTYFENLRGDDQGIPDPGSQASASNNKDNNDDNGDKDSRQEQSGNVTTFVYAMGCMEFQTAASLLTDI